AVGHRFDWATPGKVRCIYNGVDLSKFFPRQPSQALRKSLALTRSGPVVMSVGRFVRYKGYRLGPLRRIWTSFGYDEINWTSTPAGKRALRVIGEFAEQPYYVRSHYIFNSGIG